jgi:threonine dehydratase
MSLSALVRRTPLVALPGRERTWLKLECLQRTGSFKLRGAVRAVAALSDEQREAGVVVASAGNHGAGMALGCNRAGVALTVCVPPGTPRTKRDKIAAEGAEVAVLGRDYDSCEAAAIELAARRGAAYVSPYDDEPVIAGNGGDLGVEIAAQRPRLHRVIAPVGGGGLLAGLARTLAPRGVEVIGAQPERNCAMHDSLREGRALTEYRGEPTCAEGCAGAVGAATFEIARRHVDTVLLVTEAEIEAAVARCYRDLGLIVECAGAVAFAALFGGRVGPVDGDTVAVISGGNIDDAELDAILGRA